MHKYVTSFSFLPMSPVKAYLLGLAWADGYIGRNGTRFSISSKENEIEQISLLFYPEGRPLETRPNGVRILAIYCKRLVEELITFGFTSQKSYQGKPIIPQGYEKYFLLGLLDGDGCIYISKEPSKHAVLRILYSGNLETMELIQSVIASQTGMRFALRQPQHTRDRYIDNIKINDHTVCRFLVSDARESSLKFLEWLYRDTKGIPFFHRKFQVYQTFLATWNPNIICPLCENQFPHSGTTARYCIHCRTLLRRLRNRQQDFLKRKGIRLSLSVLLTEVEKATIISTQLDSIPSRPW
jgi:hypothetical protein